MKPCSTKDLSQLLNITERAVYRLAEVGTIKRNADGTWPLPDSVSKYVAGLKRERKTEVGDYNDAKTREKAAKAKLAELQVAEREGKLLTVEHVCAVNGAVYTALVGRLCNLSDGLANICHNQPAEFIATRFNDAIRSALKEVAKMDFMPNENRN